MIHRGWAGVLALAAIGVGAMPASAQFFLRSHDFAGHPVHGDEPGIVQPMPGATPAELRAELTWTLRSALNVAALQCQFEPTLSSVETYNALLEDHAVELKAAFDTLGKYYARTAKTKLAGQNALDQFGTRTYSGFATVNAQLGFCQTAASIGRDALFTPRGHLGDLAEARMQELRNSLTPFGEERFYGTRALDMARTPLPSLDPRCWDKKGAWSGKCGAQNWPPAGAGLATR